MEVAPSDVESVALGFEGIADCICIAVDDRITTHALKLLVVMQDGFELDCRALGSYLAKHLEAYMIPRFYEQVSEVKRTYNGKLDRKAYR